MSRINWDAFVDLDRRLGELQAEHTGLDNGELHAAIAAQLNEEFAADGLSFTPDSVRNRLTRLTFAALNERPIHELMPYFTKYAAIIKGETPAPPKLIGERTVGEHLAWMLEGQKKTLVLSDLHIPTQSDEAIQRAVSLNLAADLVILNGDIGDLHSISSFAKKKDYPIYAELDGIIRFFEWISEVFVGRHIRVTFGNHEERVYRRIGPAIPAGLEFLVNLDLLEALARPFANISIAADWFVSVGDAVYAHSEAVSAVPGRPAVSTADWFHSHARELGIVPPRLVVQAHTHKVSVVYTHAYKAVESGCLCLVQDYSRTTRYPRPQQQGYVVAIQRGGVTDIANSREYILGRSA